jgi:hypothetical protein
MMNKCLRYFGLIIFMLVANSAVWAICDTESKNEQDAEGPARANSEAVQQKKLTDLLQLFTEGGQKYRDELRISIEQKLAGDLELRTSASRRRQLTNLQLTLCLLSAASQSSTKQNDTANGNKNNSVSATDSQRAQAAQQQSQQAQQQAQQTQARADQARQGKRKTHDPAAEAHECIANDTTPGLFGGFRNQCNYKVSFYSCNFKPRVVQGGFNWSADFDCEQQKFGLYDMGPGGKTAAHTNNTETVYFFACKSPATPVDVDFVAGQGARGRCSN